MPKLIGRNGNESEKYRHYTSICRKIGNYFWATLILYLLIMFNERLTNPAYENIKFDCYNYIEFNSVIFCAISVLYMFFYIVWEQRLKQEERTLSRFGSYVMYCITCYIVYNFSFYMAFIWYLKGEENTERLLIFLFCCALVKVIIPFLFGQLHRLLSWSYNKLENKWESHKKQETETKE
ncbi:hypothetical protein acsn021_11210 [Anaerocolumna cellulosilytica]|uniref:Uncharacterized protein n=1 Tax=Anaerocolumna cellulosilytica TaxID=433286 RepID=A0A6S6R220_9FIRM|nr:hypothetical protein [Anaerocolumna cellulosilytica]MBB5194608.1 hypothetical protein [Anaerocolumna cellulosilytica]BCJ93552.1 hypothetical protein acsn021_11210 [Anaerocolumna cellulosilytica]